MNYPITSLAVITMALLPSTPYADTVSKRVDLDGIKHIHLLGDYDLTITQGSDEFVLLTAEDEVINEIEAKVQGRKLVLGKESGTWKFFGNNAGSDFNVSFAVQVQELRSVNNMGPGNVDIKNITTDEDLALSNMGPGRFDIQFISVEDFDFHNFGPGRLQVTGLKADKIDEKSFGIGKSTYLDIHVKEFEISSFGVSSTTIDGDSVVETLDISISGAGEVDSENISVKEADISLRGAGVVHISVLEKIEVDISGDGKVFYRGEPEIKKSIDGSGEVTPLGK